MSNSLTSLSDLSARRRARALAYRVAAADTVNSALDYGADVAGMTLAVAMSSIWHDHASEASTLPITCQDDVLVGSVAIF